MNDPCKEPIGSVWLVNQIPIALAAPPGLITPVSRKQSDLFLALALVFAVFLWGGNNVGVKVLVGTWPPIWTGGSRFLCAGLLLAAFLNFSRRLGSPPISPQLRWRLWWQGGLSLAVYIVVFNTALRYTSASHVALYLGASPVWALFWEGMPAWTWHSARRYGAAMLALSGVGFLFWPAIQTGESTWLGEVLGLAASVLWTHYGRQCRALAAELPSPKVTAATMWRAGALLTPLSLIEIHKTGLVWSTELVLIQVYCILGGGVVAFGIWNYALKRWPASQVLLFNNLIPLSTTGWVAVCFKEAIPGTFWLAMLLVVTGVLLGQANWQSLLPARAVPPE